MRFPTSLLGNKVSKSSEWGALGSTAVDVLHVTAMNRLPVYGSVVGTIWITEVTLWHMSK